MFNVKQLKEDISEAKEELEDLRMNYGMIDLYKEIISDLKKASKRNFIVIIVLLIMLFILLWWGVKLEIAKGHFYLNVSGNNNTYNTFNSDINSDCVYSFENMSGTNDNVSNVVSESEYKEVETTEFE